MTGGTNHAWSLGRDCDRTLPFKLTEFSCDNGSEFLNERLLRHFQKLSKPVKFTWRRPYKKNDAAHVEQKNLTHVRRLFGYNRCENLGYQSLMNETYRAFWNPLQNYFIPMMKLVSKERIGGRIVKKYDEPKTPYQRLLESPTLGAYQKKRLEAQFRCYDPFTLRGEVVKRMRLYDQLRKEEERERKASPF